MLKFDKWVGIETTLEHGRRVYNGRVIKTGESYAFKTKSGGEIPLYQGKVRVREGRLGQNEGRLVCLL